jgi:cobalt/nickel transport system ATP-binding protein
MSGEQQSSVREPVIQVSGLHYRYENGFSALNGVDYQQNYGETVVLFGANGSGKTTFALHLNGTLRGDGVVEVCGHRITKNDSFARRNVGFLFQDPNDQLFMPTVLEDVSFGLRNLGEAAPLAEEKSMLALKRFGIESLARRAPHQLSTGEKQRVALAGLTVLDPEILILDEPTAALDPRGIKILLEMMGSLPQTKLVISHDVKFSTAIAQRAVFFEGGKIVGEGPVQEISEQFNWS